MELMHGFPFWGKKPTVQEANVLRQNAAGYRSVGYSTSYNLL